jgi:hypothetical protein
VVVLLLLLLLLLLLRHAGLSTAQHGPQRVAAVTAQRVIN